MNTRIRHFIMMRTKTNLTFMLSFTLLFSLHATSQAEPILVDFEQFDAVDQSTFPVGGIVPEYAKLSDQLQNSYGIVFTSGSPFVTVVSYYRGVPSGTNYIWGSAPDGTATGSSDYPITITFHKPGDASVPAGTDFVSVRVDLFGNGKPVSLEAFDIDGNLIDSDTKNDSGGVTLEVLASEKIIHQVKYYGHPEPYSEIAAIDDLKFNPSEPTEPWSFVHIADPQLGNPNPVSNYLFASILNEINKCSPTPDFILVSGDIADYAWVRVKGVPVPALWNYATFFGEVLLSLKSELRDAVYLIPGNHDGYVYNADLSFPLWEYIGHSVPFADLKFHHKGILFAGFDSEDDDKHPVPEGEVHAFLQSLDEATTPKILVLHHPPMFSSSPPSSGWRETFVDYCKGANNVKLVLVGHDHRNEILGPQGQVVPANSATQPQFVQTSSASLAWFFEDPPSYRIINVQGSQVRPQSPAGPIGHRSITGVVHSPANLHIYDASGNHVGENGAGSADRGIPNSFYFSHKDVPEEVKEAFPEEIIIFEAAYDGYLYEVIGNEEDEYSLEITLKNGGEDIVFKAADIPTLPGAVHDYTIDWDVIDIGGEGVTVEIDANGDGVFERTIIADEDLTSEEFALQTETIINFDPDTVNLKAQGKWITCYIQLPSGHAVSEINVESILLEGVLAVERSDIQGNILMVKFDQQQLAQMLEPGSQTVHLTGRLTDGMPFAGVDTIRVIH